MEIVFSAADYATLRADAERLGFLNAQGDIEVDGPVTGGGRYFLNIVGPIADHSGVWGRLRVNGDPSHVPHFSDAITQYHYAPAGFWSLDGVTPAPDYIAKVGLIL